MNELYEKRAKLVQKMHDFLDEKTSADGHLSAEDDQSYSRMEKDLEAMNRDIERAERIDAIDKELSKPTSTPIRTKVGQDKGGRASDEYQKAFKDYIKRSMFSNALQEDTNSEGGYLVPLEFEKALFEKLAKVDPIFELAGRITLGSKEKVVPLVLTQGAASLIAEEGSYSESDDSFSQIAFRAYKFGKIIKVSEELLDDAVFDIEGYLARSFGKVIGEGEAAYFWTGTGSSQPQGVLTGAGNGVTTTATNKLTADEIIDLYYAVPEQYRKNGTFAFADETMREIRKLKDGNGQYLWIPGLNGTTDTILGRPVKTSTNIPTIAAGSTIGVFGDFDNFLIAERQGINFKRLNELYADNGQVGFRGTARADSHVMDSDALKTIKMHS